MIRVFNEELSEFTNLALLQPSSGWTGVNGVVTGSTMYAVLTGDGTNASPHMYATQTAPIVGHKYYVRARSKVTNSSCLAMRLVYGGVDFSMITTPTINTLYDKSSVITAISTDPKSYIFEDYTDSATANGKVMEVEALIIIDLTVKYGAGLEPASYIMDRIKPLLSLCETYAGTYTRTLCINDFTTNGEKVIQPKTCLEILEDNVDWRVELTTDLSYVSVLKQDYILVVNTKESGEQPFRINNIKVDNNEVSFSARHVGYDLNNYICSEPFGFKWITGIAFFVSRTLGYSLPVNQFYTTMANWRAGEYITFKGTTLLDNMYEIVSALGGHLVFDWWDIRIDETVGADLGATVEYGKNLQGAEVVEDWNDVCTQIYPIGNNKLTLGTTTNMLEATGVTYDRPYTRKVTFQTDDVVELETFANAYLELNKVPKLNYKVKADTVQDVGLGDTIYVFSRQFTISTNVLGYTYNVNTRQVKSIEFGNFRKDVKTVFSNIRADINELKKSVVQENITMNAKFDYLGATFLGYRAAALSFTTATETKIDVDTTSYNTDTSVFELTGGGIKVKVAGTYLVSVKNSVATTGTAGRLGVSVMHNTTQYLLDYNALLNNFQRSVGTHTLVCAVDDMIYLYGYQNSGSSRALDPTLNGNHLQVTKIA